MFKQSLRTLIHRDAWLPSLLTITLLISYSTPAAAGANIVINNLDTPGVGFNDSTPADPVGGNAGTTIGEQRLIALQEAANFWGTLLDSEVDIVVQARFEPLDCEIATSTLAIGQAVQIIANFQGAELVDTWYPVALGNSLAGIDLTPGPPDPTFGSEPFNDDITIAINDRISSDPNCIPFFSWYHGLDENPPFLQIDLFQLLIHEMAHGLGFDNFIDEATGQGPQAPPMDKDIYSEFVFDNTLGKGWNDMTPGERVQSALNDGNVVWRGPNVRSHVEEFLNKEPLVVIDSPSDITAMFRAEGALFGPRVDLVGLSGEVEVGDDAVGVTSDGCEPLLNNFEGRIALLDRGGCNFTVKVFNAQLAGASGAIVPNNLPGGPSAMGGSDPNVTIPSLGITRDQGDIIRSGLDRTVNVTMRLSETLLSGADENGFVRLFTPNPPAIGPSITHWDITVRPGLIMEPIVPLTNQNPVTNVSDLTRFLFQDLGWRLADLDGDGFPDVDDTCPNSDTAPTIIIGSCNTRAENDLLAEGCTISDRIQQCAENASHPVEFLRCVIRLSVDLLRERVIRFREFGDIVRCAIRSSYP